MILFDTRNNGSTGAGRADLHALSDLLPPLVPLPSNHVLTRSYYLLKSFPGRLGDEAIWVEAGTAPPPEEPGAAPAEFQAHSEHISSVIWGDNDWAGAWATGANGQALFAMRSSNNQQRELSYRFGVNLIMYALTGNYKQDQLHLPAILERLGR